MTGTVTVISMGGPDPNAVPRKCPQCARWFVPTRGMQNVSCCVNHAGGCCHFSDTEVKAPEWSSPVADIEWESFS